jgi:hypothetical protein
VIKPNIKYRVTLTAEERERLRNLVRNGRTADYHIRHVWILLALDEIPANESRTDQAIAAAYGSNIRSIGNYPQTLFVEKGLRRPWNGTSGRCPRLSGQAEWFEIHYTPKHGCWFNMAKLEIGGHEPSMPFPADRDH